MPIIAIISEPGSASLPKVVPAYRPVLFRVSATRTDGAAQPPVVYCDVYFDDIYYKTVEATIYKKLNASNTEWEFNVADPAQEFLRRDIPVNGGSTLIMGKYQVTKCFCRFRSSGYDLNNFITPEGVTPVQGTGLVAASEGSGDESETFLIINATLQHEDSPDFITHLDNITKNGTWADDAYPLSHRKTIWMCSENSDYFPFLYLGNEPVLKIRLNIKQRGSSSYDPAPGTVDIPQTCALAVTGVTPVVQSNNDVITSYGGVPDGTYTEYSVNGGPWIAVPSNPFTISFNQLAMYLITEAGQPIITDDQGQIIIPEIVDVFDVVHNIEVRPRCANGIYGTSDDADFTISSAPACTALVQFDFAGIDYLTDQITFDVELPSGETDLHLGWKFDYGGGFVTPETIMDFTPSSNPGQIQFDIPAGYPTGGSFIFRARTKCDVASYSAWSAPVTVPYNPTLTEVTLTLDSIVNNGSGGYVVHVTLSDTTADDLDIRGYFLADNESGGQSTFGIVIILTAGQTEGTCTTAGAPIGGSADLVRSHIEIVRPNPTSDDKTIVY